MKKIFYFHGGPGFNSNPERQFLSEIWRLNGVEAYFWDEPSVLREDGTPHGANAFDHYLASAETYFLNRYEGGAVEVVAHSFGTNVVSHLLKTHPEKIKQVTLISPCFSMESLDRNLMQMTRFDYEAYGDAKAGELNKVLENYSGSFDANTQNAYVLMSQNPRFFSFYWFNQIAMGKFLTGFASAPYTVDVEGFLAVRNQFRAIDFTVSEVPVLAVFGKHDTVISTPIEIDQLQKRFKNLSIEKFENSAHYPHAEEADAFIRVLSAFKPGPTRSQMPSRGHSARETEIR